MATDLARVPADAGALMEQVLIRGDLAALSAEERARYYTRVCESLGLNPLTRPFEYLTLQGRLTLYARKDATDQLRRIHRVSITRLEREQLPGEIYVVTAYAATSDGRTDCAIGAVSLKGLTGDALANALMRCETKAKRRVTLSICGLGMLDETELDTLPAAERQPAEAPPAPAPPRAASPATEAESPVEAFYGWAQATHGLDRAAVRQLLQVPPESDDRAALQTACRAYGLPLTTGGLLRLRGVLQTLVEARIVRAEAEPTAAAGAD